VKELVVAAPLRIEAALISSAARGARVRKTGMGTVKSKAAVQLLEAETAPALLIIGFCGGLDAESVPGEVIIPPAIYAAADEGHQEERIGCELAGDLVSHLAGRGLKLRTGDLVSVSRIAVGDRREELRATGAIAVDMESVWLAAGARGRPFGVVRVVLDSPSHELLRIGAIAGALRAAGALRRVAGALHDFSPAV
jgi:4-hydroxy-3-methylbut-2-enyl diphosphate reductase